MNAKQREQQSNIANFMAAVVRNQIGKSNCNFSDEQMQELNHIVRNSIYTVLFRVDEDPVKFATYEIDVPKEWGYCELLEI
jgi:hypothetical protein